MAFKCIFLFIVIYNFVLVSFPYKFMCILVTLNFLFLNCKLLFLINNSTFTSQNPLPTHHIFHIKLWPPSSHCYIYPINNSTFTSQYPLTTHTTSAITNYNLPTPTVTYFQLTILHLRLSIPWPHTPHLSHQIITSQLPLFHISN